MAFKADLASDIEFIKTPHAQPSKFETGEDCGVPITKVSEPRHLNRPIRSASPC